MVKSIKLKQSLVIALLAIAITTPALVSANSDNETVEEPEQSIVQPVVDADMIVETPVTEVAVETTTDTTVDDVEVVVEEDEESIDPTTPVMTAISLSDAITIAEAEHPDVEVVLAKVKLKKLGEEKVYKVVFADGWRVYIAVDDGEILRIKDASNKEHDCSKNGQNAVQAWQSRKWEHRKTHHEGNQRRDWSKYSDNNESEEEQSDDSEETPVETEQTPTEDVPTNQ